MLLVFMVVFMVFIIWCSPRTRDDEHYEHDHGHQQEHEDHEHELVLVFIFVFMVFLFLLVVILLVFMVLYSCSPLVAGTSQNQISYTSYTPSGTARAKPKVNP